MAAIDWAAVVALASSLSSVSDEAQALILAHVNTALDTRRFAYGECDPRLTLARTYLAAHMGSSSLPGAGTTGAAGPVTSESAGSLSVSYAQIMDSASDSLLDTTSFGKLYRLVMRPLRGGFVA